MESRYKKISNKKQCAVFGCKYKVGDPHVKKHTFPKNEYFKQRWVKLCGRKQPFNPDTSIICGRHFSDKNKKRNMKYELLGVPPPIKYRCLKEDAIPDLNLPSTAYVSGSTSKAMNKSPLNNDSRSTDTSLPTTSNAKQDNVTSDYFNPMNHVSSRTENAGLLSMYPFLDHSKYLAGASSIHSNQLYNRSFEGQPSNQLYNRSFEGQPSNQLYNRPFEGQPSNQAMSAAFNSNSSFMPQTLSTKFPGMVMLPNANPNLLNYLNNQRRLYALAHLAKSNTSTKESSNSFKVEKEPDTSLKSMIDIIKEEPEDSVNETIDFEGNHENSSLNTPIICKAELDSPPHNTTTEFSGLDKHSILEPENNKTSAYLSSKRDNDVSSTMGDDPLLKCIKLEKEYDEPVAERNEDLEREQSHDNNSSLQVLVKICEEDNSESQPPPKEELHSSEESNIINFVNIEDVKHEEKEDVLLGKKEPFCCSQCGFKTLQQRRLSDHVKHHSGEWPFSCDICQFGSLTQQALARHLTVHEETTCPICQFTSASKMSLVAHMHTHFDNRELQCNICSYTCLKSSTLKHHMQTHTGVWKHECEVCDYKCGERNRMVAHMKTHTTERPYDCPYCEFRSARKSGVQQHIITHSKELKYKCVLCDFQCSYKQSLDEHKAKHMGFYPYQCELCSYKCHRSGHLKQHMISHTKKKIYPCEICGKTFAYKCSLRKHIAIHNKYTRHRCKLCRYVGITMNDLLSHQTTQHGVVNVKTEEGLPKSETSDTMSSCETSKEGTAEISLGEGDNYAKSSIMKNNTDNFEDNHNSMTDNVKDSCSVITSTTEESTNDKVVEETSKSSILFNDEIINFVKVEK